MLREINFSDWRSARKKALYRHWGLSILTGCCLLSVIEWMSWKDYRTELQHWQWQHTQIRSSLTDTEHQLSLWQQRALEQQNLRGDALVRTSWLAASQRPFGVMQMIQQTLPDGVYLDSLTLTDSSLIIAGLASDQEQGARFVANLQSHPFIQNIEQFRMDPAITRWQHLFRPFELRVETQPRDRPGDKNE